MKDPLPADRVRLAGLLEDALSRERQLWKVPVFKNGRIVGTDISSFQYEDAVLWLGELSSLFKFCPQTFSLGVCILNRLLASVKANPKYLKCIAMTSLVLAAKINEEDEVMASVKDLVVQSGCNFSTAEIIRMERIILDKLHWDLYTATPVEFIHIFRALATSGHPRLLHLRAQKKPCFQTALWTRQVQHCMVCHQLTQFKGSTLALAIITLELEMLTPDWFTVFTDLLKKAQIESTELIFCKEMVDEYLSSHEFPFQTNAVYIFDTAHVTSIKASGPKLGAHAQERGQASGGEKDEFYDGFKCLYSDGATTDDRGDSSPCPPLKPPDGYGQSAEEREVGRYQAS